MLGTGVVGRTLTEGLASSGHHVVIGTRDVGETMARSEPGPMGQEPFSQWRFRNPGIDLTTYSQAARRSELAVNATAGTGSLAALSEAGPEHLAGKVLVDVANPLDFSQGMPPLLSVVNVDSLAEQIQRALPETSVVKALNMVNHQVMVNPSRVPGRHDTFIAGNDDQAKETVRALLRGLGWKAKSIIDLGGIRAARGMEMYLPLWLTMLGQFGTPDFNIRIVRG